MVSIFRIGLDAIYNGPIGTDATFEALPGKTLRVVDKTVAREAKPIPGGPAMPTVGPGACVRRYELDEAGLASLADLIKKSVTFNGQTWTIFGHQPLPQPGGEAEGEILLLLRKL